MIGKAEDGAIDGRLAMGGPFGGQLVDQLISLLMVFPGVFGQLESGLAQGLDVRREGIGKTLAEGFDLVRAIDIDLIEKLHGQFADITSLGHRAALVGVGGAWLKRGVGKGRMLQGYCRVWQTIGPVGPVKEVKVHPNLSGGGIKGRFWPIFWFLTVHWAPDVPVVTQSWA